MQEIILISDAGDHTDLNKFRNANLNSRHMMAQLIFHPCTQVILRLAENISKESVTSHM